MLYSFFVFDAQGQQSPVHSYVAGADSMEHYIGAVVQAYPHIVRLCAGGYTVDVKRHTDGGWQPDDPKADYCGSTLREALYEAVDIIDEYLDEEAKNRGTA